ncbi:MAG: hypothetical protein LBL66_04965 [Clostridiales bacterium]|nr:hypothetical protein [Clostridiales bacterium]
MHSPQFRSGEVCAWGVLVFGRDCRVALRAPRNDKRGVRAPRNDRTARSPQCTVHS